MGTSKRFFTYNDVKLFDGTLTVGEISKITNRDFSTVRAFFLKRKDEFNLKVAEHKSKKEHLEELRLKGVDFHKAIEITGCTYGYAKSIYKGFITRGADFTEEELIFIIQNYRTLRITNIAKHLKRDYTTVKNKIYALRKCGDIVKTRYANMEVKSKWDIKF
ncbi:MAG: hypothetical protein ACRC0G_13800 [Fusobacteriaceae bacterium]